jgi:hypothetical protein
MARVANTVREMHSEDPFISLVKEYQFVKSQAEALAARQKELRDSIIETVDALGEPDDVGHIWLELPDQIEGVRGLVKERRVSQKLDEDRAQEILQDNDLLTRCTKFVRQVDEDEVMEAKREDLLTDDDLESMYETKVSWALKLK